MDQDIAEHTKSFIQEYVQINNQWERAGFPRVYNMEEVRHPQHVPC